MITVAIDNNPLNGAAYQVLYVRTMPASCVTRERQAEIQGEFADVLKWAATQEAPINSAYQWATDLIGRQIEQSLATNELNDKINASLETMPKPPARGKAA